MTAQSARIGPDGRLHLPEVTLVAASSLAIEPTLRALRISMQSIRFGAVKFFTDAPGSGPGWTGIERIGIDRLNSRSAYSCFMLDRLADHIETDFAICIQWDGYILSPFAWNDEWLEHDYIGALWPQFDDGMNVGNGGFSFRSRRLLQACRDHRVPRDMAEDIAICRAARTMLEQEYGIRFAPQAVAEAFSYERTRPSGAEFGFHGVFNMPRHMPRKAFRTLYAGLEPAMHSRFETREMVRIALRRLDLPLTLLAYRRIPNVGK